MKRSACTAGRFGYEETSASNRAEQTSLSSRRIGRVVAPREPASSSTVTRPRLRCSRGCLATRAAAARRRRPSACAASAAISHREPPFLRTSLASHLSRSGSWWARRRPRQRHLFSPRARVCCLYARTGAFDKLPTRVGLPGLLPSSSHLPLALSVSQSELRCTSNAAFRQRPHTPENHPPYGADLMLTCPAARPPATAF